MAPVIALGGASLGLSAGVSNLLGGIILSVAGGLLQLLLAPKPPKPDDGKSAIQTAISPCQFCYGTARMAGAIAFYESPAGTLYYSAAITAHPIDSILQYWLHDDAVNTDSSDEVLGVAGGGDGRYHHGKLQMAGTLGPVPNAPFWRITADLTEEQWGSRHRGDGCATLSARFKDAGSDEQQKIFPFGVPKPGMTIKGYKVFDHRVGGQDWTNPDTWQWSNNPVICLIHYLCFSKFGPQRSYERCILPVIDRWMVQADICDEAIPLKDGGTINRYELGGFATTENDPHAILALFLSSMDGHLVERGGTIILWVGKWQESTVTITDDDILGYYMQFDLPDEEAINRLDMSYTSPDHKYNQVPTDPFVNDEDQLARGYVRQQPFDLIWVQHNAQARRLGKREMFRLRQLRGKIRLKLHSLNAAYERVVYVQSSIIPRLNGQWIEVRPGTRTNLTQGGFIDLEFSLIDPSIDDWSPAADEGEPPPNPDEFVDDGPQPPSDINYVAEQFQLTGGSFAVRLAVSFDAPAEPENNNLGYRVQWRVAVDTGTENAWTTVVFSSPPEDVGGVLTVRTGVVPGDTTLDVQVASQTSRGTLSVYSVPVEVDTTVDNVAPASVEDLIYTAFTDTVKLEWDSPNTPSFNSAYVYQNTVNDLGTATLLNIVYGAPASHQTYTTGGGLSGTYYFWVRSANESDVLGTAVTTGAVVV